MTSPAVDSDYDLTLQRVIRASASDIWRAWTDPARLAQWWIPAPMVTRVDQLDVSPGGGFVTSMSEDGKEFVSHTDGVFLVVEKDRRLVFTNAVSSAWRPAAPEPVAMTAEIVLADHPDGTDYQVVVRHGTPAIRARHHDLGFFEGWGSVTAALANLAEQEAAA
ncbi:SRPBCC domain-containing protein [Nocardia callitridis]|uniref:SRPBCC family protein n=1 Tax=Nocardia callitridis TaxID=648753 RepID=A0ABP9KVK4_9NOCA